MNAPTITLSTVLYDASGNTMPAKIDSSSSLVRKRLYGRAKIESAMNDIHHAIIGIYDAATDETRWQETLNRTVDDIGSSGGSMMMVDTLGESPYTLSYLGGQQSQRLVEDTEIYTDYVSAKERADYRFLREHTGVERRVIARLNSNKSWFDAVAFQFSVGQTQIPRESLDAAGHLLPHLAKSFELGRIYRLLRTRYQGVIAALDKVKVRCIQADRC